MQHISTNLDFYRYEANRLPSCATIAMWLPIAFIGAAPLCACGSTTAQLPSWTYTTVDYGQGQLRLGIRVRSVAEADKAGALIRTPDGGEALVRVFACGSSIGAVRAAIRQRLRGRLVGSQLFTYKGVLAWRWRRGKALSGTILHTGVIPHGPLLISVTSANMPLEEVVELASRVRLELPIPLIRGCLPICDLDETTPCVPDDQQYDE